MLQPTAMIELVYMDETGSTSAVVVNVPSTSSIAVIDAQATALASLIAPMTDATLIKMRYSYRVKYQANISDAGSNPIVVAGAFFFNTSDDIPMALVIVPSIKSSLFVHIGPTSEYGIDLTNSDVIAFIDALIADNATNPFGDVITSISAAYRQSRV